MKPLTRLLLVCLALSWPLHARPADPALESRLAMQSADKLRAKKDFQGALRADQTAVRLQPQSGTAWFSLGIDYVLFNRLDEARYSFKRSILASPDDAAKWTALCLAHYLAGDFDHAIHTCQQAVSLDPSQADAWAWMGLGYARQKRWDLSVPCLEVATDLDTGNSLAWYTLGVRYAQQGRRTEVLEIYRRLRQLAPNQAIQFYKVAVFPQQRG
jgi:tetratricopeptide (TPR) repeat protein